jgi:pimeloyl-ACP methyl ester carboxylesterase
MPLFKYKEINLYYEIAGEGPPLFLINGIAADTRQWEPLVSRLKTSFQVVSYDMRCAGRSDKPDLPFSIEDIADEAYALIRHLRYDKFYMLGFSMGGMAAMSLAHRHPDIIRKIFLVATTPSLKRPHPFSDEMMKMFRRTDVSPALLTQVYESIFGSKYREIVSADDYISLRMNDDNPQPAFAYLQQIRALESCDLCEKVRKISVPAVVIVGDEDKIIPPENSLWLNSHLINSKLYTFEGIGHMIPVEAPDQLADVLISNK